MVEANRMQHSSKVPTTTSLGCSGPIVPWDIRAQLGPWAVLAQLVPGTFGHNWSLGRSGQLDPEPSLRRSGPIGPWAIRAQSVPGLFGPSWTLGRSGPYVYVGHVPAAGSMIHVPAPGAMI